MKYRHFKSFILIVCIFLLLPSVVTMTARTSAVYMSKAGTHIVTKGETVYSIARLYDLSVADIYIANPNMGNEIKVGDILNIPASTIVTKRSGVNTPNTYIVQSKETLYSIAKQHGVKIEDLVDSNPELKDKPLSSGQVLRLPSLNNSFYQPTISNQTNGAKSQFKTHLVDKKETLYGISKQYNVAPEAIIDFNPILKDGLKVGDIIIIPTVEVANNQIALTKNTNAVNVGILLPFIGNSDSKTARFVEYYEGFLLAISEMKSRGMSVNVYTFDLGSDTNTDKLNSLLETYEVKYLDAILGGVSPEQIELIANFAKEQGIKYIIPFPTKRDNLSDNPQVFLVNAPHSILYANVAKTFPSLFPNANIIYVTENGQKGDRSDFIEALNTELPRYGMIASSVDNNQSLRDDLALKLDVSRRNIIIPTSASSKMLNSLLPSLNSLSDEYPTTNITLFGHTDWQTYGQFAKDFSKFDTYIYAPFFFNEKDYRSQQFIENHKKWYPNKSLIRTYPRYGVMGYDTGISFLTALQRLGKTFDSDTNSLSVSSLQTPFLFKKMNATSGYMNNGFYIVHYRTDGNIDKTEYGR